MRLYSVFTDLIGRGSGMRMGSCQQNNVLTRSVSISETTPDLNPRSYRNTRCLSVSGVVWPYSEVAGKLLF